MASVLDVKIVPCSGKQEILVDKSGLLKIFLKKKPENNEANAELIKFLSKKLDLAENSITILTGKKARKKKIKINMEINLEEILSILGVRSL